MYVSRATLAAVLASGTLLIACGGSSSSNGPPGVPTAVSVASGNNQTQEQDSVFYQVLKARVKDANGDAVSASTVTWSVRSGSGSLSATSSSTDLVGDAAITVTAGSSSGPLIVQAKSAAAGDSITFTLTVEDTPGARVRASNFAFTSGNNGTANPAADTIAVNQTVKWYLVAGTHSIASQGSPAFTSSGQLTAVPYENLFFAPGTYQYNCGIHGNQMTGNIVVQ
jgi:plastocyanin